MIIMKDLSISILRINMDYHVQYILNNNYYLKRFLRENSRYYKDLIRNPNFIYKLNEIMKKEYKLTIPDKIEKFKNDLKMFSSVMDIFKE